MFEQLSILQELLTTPAEYIEIDNKLPTSELMTDKDIIQFVLGQSEAGISDEKDSEGEEDEGPDSDSAAVDVPMHYFKRCQQTTQDDIQPCLTKRHVNSLRVAAQKQSSILDFFHRPN